MGFRTKDDKKGDDDKSPCLGREYFRIDLCGWSGQEVHEAGEEKWENLCSHYNEQYNFNEHYWNLEIAVEFENMPRSWGDEVIKLCHVVCGLKVVIGYARHDDRKNDTEKLEIMAKHMKKLVYVKQPGGQFLVILGNSGKGNNYEYKDFDKDIEFVPFLWNGESFEKKEWKTR